MSGYMTYGSEIISLRGYEDYSLTPMRVTPYSSSGTYAGNIYDKFTVELRYPVILEPQSTIYVLGFLEGGNCWADIREFNPFQIDDRPAGRRLGLRLRRRQERRKPVPLRHRTAVLTFGTTFALPPTDTKSKNYNVI